MRVRRSDSGAAGERGIRGGSLCTACVILLLLVAAAPAGAQEDVVEEVGGSALSAAIGATAGLVGGGYANLAVVVLKARMGHYQHDFKEAFGWESIPIAAGTGIGFSIGLWDHDRLWPWILGGTAGFGAGAGVGYLVGSVLWGDSESKWANAAVGAAVGMAIGSTAALLLAAADDDSDAAAAVDARPGRPRLAVPLLILRF